MGCQNVSKAIYTWEFTSMFIFRSKRGRWSRLLDCPSFFWFLDWLGGVGWGGLGVGWGKAGDKGTRVSGWDGGGRAGQGRAYCPFIGPILDIVMLPIPILLFIRVPT